MGHRACHPELEAEDTVAVDDVPLGLIKFGPLWLRVYRIELRDSKFYLHSVARNAYDALHDLVPEDGRVYYDVEAPDGSHMFHGYQPADTFAEAWRAGPTLADVWMEFPLSITKVA